MLATHSETSRVERRADGRVVKRWSPSLRLQRRLDAPGVDLDLIGNEARWLRRLDGGPFPRLVEVLSGKTGLVLTDCGDPVTAETMPPDWREQARGILDALAAAHCRHADIKPPDLLIRDGVLRLCDFGWALPLDAPIPTYYWTLSVGSLFRPRTATGRYVYDDACSIVLSLGAILRLSAEESQDILASWRGA